jgi:PAS domain S-box-containing protein
MPSPAANIYFASPHPWSAAIRALSDISFLAFVIQIEDESDAMAKLRIASVRNDDNTQQMAVAGLIKDVCAKFVIIDSTPAFLYAVDKKTLHAATNFVRRELADVSVSKGLGFLNGLLTGSPMVGLALTGQLRLPRLKLTMHSRRSEKDVLQILVSAQWDADRQSVIPRESRLRGVLDAAADFIVAVNLNGKIEFMNGGMIEIFGQKCVSENKDISDIVSSDSTNKFAEVSTLIARSGEPWRGVFEFSHPTSGEVIPVNCQITLMRDIIDQKANGYCISGYRNIGKNPLNPQGKPFTNTQDEAARLALVGRIANHTLHEIKSPVTVIRSRAKKMRALLAPEPTATTATATEVSSQLDENVAKILTMSNRINKIMAGMKNLSRNNAVEDSKSVNLANLLSEVSELVTVAVRKMGVRLEFASVAESIVIQAQSLRISQVLINLVINACEVATSSKGKWVTLDVVTEHDWLYIVVTDSGEGLSQELKTRLFEPNFTTKSTGQVSGVGLNLSRKIAREHGGDLYLDESSPRTRFVLELPLSEVGHGLGFKEDWEEI